MGWISFGKPREPEKPKHKGGGPRGHIDPNRQLKMLELQQKRLLTKQFMEAVASDPELRDQALEKEYGIRFRKDPMLKAQEELRAQFAPIVLRLIQENPELANKIAVKMANEVIGEDGSENGKGKKKGAHHDLLESLDALEELQERLGKGGGRGGNQEVIVEAIKTLPLILPALFGPSGGGERQRVYVVPQPDGSFVETDALGYARMLKQQKQLGSGTPPAVASGAETVTTQAEAGALATEGTPVAATPVRPPAPLPAPPSPIAVGPAPSSSPSSSSSMGIAGWLEYLDQDPSVFVADVLGRKEVGDTQAVFVFGILTTRTAEEVIVLLQQFKADPQYRGAIEKIETRRDWLARVIEQLKATMV